MRELAFWQSWGKRCPEQTMRIWLGGSNERKELSSYRIAKHRSKRRHIHAWSKHHTGHHHAFARVFLPFVVPSSGVRPPRTLLTPSAGIPRRAPGFGGVRGTPRTPCVAWPHAFAWRRVQSSLSARVGPVCEVCGMRCEGSVLTAEFGRMVN